MKNENKICLTLALIGLTTTGKTTFIRCLCRECPILETLTHDSDAGKTDGRSKINTEYVFSFDDSEGDDSEDTTEENNLLTVIKLSMKPMKKRFDKDLNANVDDEETLKLRNEVFDVIDLKYSKDTINGQEFTGKAKCVPEKLKNILNDSKYEKVINRVTIALTPTQDFIKKINEKVKNQPLSKLIFRDTQGILDMEKDKDGNFKIKSFNEMGLDNINAAIFFNSSEIPTTLANEYRDSIRKVLNSIPVFLISSKNELLSDFFTDGIFNEENYEKLPKAKCMSAIKYLQNCGISPNIFINKDEFESFHMNLFYDSQTFDLYRSITAHITSVISHKIISMYNEILSDLNNENSAPNTHIKVKVLKNMNRYSADLIENLKSTQNTAFFRPQINYITKDDIIRFLSKDDKDILGTKGGITTLSNGKRKFPETCMLGVSVERFLDKLIEEIEDPKIKQILRVKKFKFIDAYAMIDYYLIVNRSSLKNAINDTRSKSYYEEEDILWAFILSIVDEFIRTKIEIQEYNDALKIRNI